MPSRDIAKFGVNLSMIKKLLTTVAVSGALVTTPALAQEATFDRAPAPVEEAEKMDGPGLLLFLVGGVVVVLGIIVATGTDNADELLPQSP